MGGKFLGLAAGSSVLIARLGGLYDDDGPRFGWTTAMVWLLGLRFFSDFAKAKISYFRFNQLLGVLGLELDGEWVRRRTRS